MALNELDDIEFPDFNAVKDRKFVLQPSFAIDPKQLEVRGKIVDCIKSVVPHQFEKFNINLFFHSFLPIEPLLNAA